MVRKLWRNADLFRLKKVWFVLLALILAFPFMALPPPASAADTAGSMTFTFEAGDYKMGKDDSGLDTIAMSGFADTDSPGDPVLPVKVYNIALPPDIDWSSLKLSIVSPKTKAIDGTFDIKPAPPFATDVDGKKVEEWGEGKEIVNGKNRKVYGASAQHPASYVELLPYSQMRKWQIANVAFYPFQYNPVAQKLNLATAVTIELSYTRSAAQAPGAALANDTVMDDVAAEMLLNYNEAKPIYQAQASAQAFAPSVVYNYVIITTNAIVAGSTKLNAFKTHKISKGHSVLVVTETTPSGGWGAMVGVAPNQKADKIRKWLQTYYVTYGIKNVLLIGNPDPYGTPGLTEGDVPMKMCWPRNAEATYKEAPTDYYYADLTGNWNKDGDAYFGEYTDYTASGGVDLVPEVYVGRIPVYSAAYSTLDTILQKIINYETATVTAWRKSALLPMAHSDSGTDGGYYGEQIKSNILVPKGFTDWTMYQRRGVGTCAHSVFTPDQVLTGGTAVRTRWAAYDYGVVCWWGHGSNTGAYVGYSGCDNGVLFDYTGTAYLDDTHPSFTYQSSCLNGYPEDANNLQYAILKKGGIGTVSATRVSWYMPGQTNFVNSSSNCGIGYQYLSYLIGSNYAAGKSLYDAKSYLRSYHHGWGGTALMNYYDFNLYGDPTTGLGASGSTVTPPAANLISPYNQTMTFKWYAVPTAANYVLEVNTSSSFAAASRVFYGSVGNVTTYDVTVIPNGIWCYWRLWSRNAAGVWSSPSIGTRFILGASSPPTSITVVQPNTNEFWAIGSTRTIQWTYLGGNSATVRIELLKNGVLNRTIATAANIGSGGVGSYNWTVPTGQTTGNDFKIRLTTSNALTDSSDVNFTIMTPQKIQVELSWNTNDTDVDTHYLRSPYTRNNSTYDCYYANRTPNWGTDGHPVLDRDDTNGFGPEITTHNDPGTATYQYHVYYWSDHSHPTPATTATVKVWVNGVLKGTWNQTITNNQWWKVFSVAWPSGTVTPINTIGAATQAEIEYQQQNPKK